MADEMPGDIYAQLRRDEGEVLHAYPDHLGYLTIGVGRLIDKRRGGGISREESTMLLCADVARIEAALDQRAPWWRSLSPPRRAVLLNMGFQLGVGGLMGFTRTLRHVRVGEWDQAADQMLQSLWARQTPERAMRLADQMRFGGWR